MIAKKCSSHSHLNKKNTNFIFNIRNKKFEQDIDSEMLTDLDGNIYENKILQIQAKDGAFFPVKLFFRSGLKLDGNNPTFVEGYGGFNVNSYFHDSYYSASRATFIQSGGIWVAPILRGDGDLEVIGENRPNLKKNKIHLTT
jgi:prolyl oligopeptidase